MIATHRVRPLIVLLIAAAACRAGDGSTPTGPSDGTRATLDGARTTDSTLDGRLVYRSDPDIPLTARFRRTR